MRIQRSENTAAVATCRHVARTGTSARCNHVLLHESQVVRSSLNRITLSLQKREGIGSRQLDRREVGIARKTAEDLSFPLSQSARPKPQSAISQLSLRRFESSAKLHASPPSRRFSGGWEARPSFKLNPIALPTKTLAIPVLSRNDTGHRLVHGTLVFFVELRLSWRKEELVRGGAPFQRRRRKNDARKSRAPQTTERLFK